MRTTIYCTRFNKKCQSSNVDETEPNEPCANCVKLLTEILSEQFFSMNGPYRILTVLIALFLASFCYFYGAVRTREGSHYTGIRAINASDYNVNLSWIQQFREGHFLLKNLYSSEPHQGALVRPVYWLVTMPFTRIFSNNTIVLHVSRIACGAILLFALIPFFRTFGRDEKSSNLAAILLIFTSGAGILLHQWLPDSADLGLPEAILFLALGEPPHFLYSLFLLWLGAAALYKLPETKLRGLGVYLIALILLWWEHPFDAVTLSAIAVASLWHQAGLRWRLIVLLMTLLAGLPSFLYYRELQTIPAFSGWAAQNVMLSPSPVSFLSAFFPLLLMAAPGSISLWKNTESRRFFYFLTAWILVQSALIYGPFPYQRRLIAGLQFPLALLAARGLLLLKGRLALIIVVIFASTNVFVARQQVLPIRQGGMPYYLPDDYVKAFQWLASQEEKGVVLSGFVTGNFIPAYTGHAVYTGHSALTPDMRTKRKKAADFYVNPDHEFIRANRIDYVFAGVEERHLTEGSSKISYPVVYRNKSIVVYQTGSGNPDSSGQ